MSHKALISQCFTCTSQDLRGKEIHKSWEFPLTLSCLSQVSAQPTHILFLTSLIHLILLLFSPGSGSELLYCPFKSDLIFLCKQICHNNMTGCRSYHNLSGGICTWHLSCKWGSSKTQGLRECYASPFALLLAMFWSKHWVVGPALSLLNANEWCLQRSSAPQSHLTLLGLM